MALRTILRGFAVIVLLTGCGPNGHSGNTAVTDPGSTSPGSNNSAPVANTDTAAMMPGASKNIAVLVNDEDPDNDPISIISVDNPTHGTATIDTNGTPDVFHDDTILYTPHTNYLGSDTFSYTIGDNSDGRAAGVVSISIGVNLVTPGAPLALNDAAITAVDKPVTIPVLDNDLDSDGDSLVITSITASAYGSATIDDGGTPADHSDDSIRYQPAAGYVGPDSFLYTITDGITAVTAAVSVNITPPTPAGLLSANVSGVVMKGPLIGAQISLFSITGDGNKATLLPVAQTVTDASGYWEAFVPLPREDLLVVSRGGAYQDEAQSQGVVNKNFIKFANSNILETVLPATDTHAVLSVYSNALLLKSRYGTAGGDFMSKHGQARSAAITAFGFDPLVAEVANPANPATNSSEEARRHALVLGGAANAINRISTALGKPNPDHEMVYAIVRDLSDCQLDGKDLYGPITFTFGGVPTAIPTNIDLNTEILRFRNNNFNNYVGTPFATVDTTRCAALVVASDTTAPIITLLGSDPLPVALNAVFNDPGVSAIDNLDGDITGSVTGSGTVNTSVPGSYVLTYSVSDMAGNIATISRTIVVVTGSSPVITLLGASSFVLEAGTPYIDAGASAADPEDGDLSASIITGNPVDTLVPGTYAVTYDVTDSDGLSATTISRSVVIVDTTAPALTLAGPNVVNVQENDPYIDAGATALDIVDGNLSATITIINPVDTSVTGTYTVAYQVADSAGNIAIANRTVNVIPTGTPSIILSGAAIVNVEAGGVYNDAGATALDPEDGDISAVIVVVNLVDSTVTGTYVITYNVVDSDGKSAAEVTRTVIVADTTPPAITLAGSPSISLLAGATYVDMGATAFDSFEGDLSAGIVISNPVDTSTVGVYTVRYDVSDSSGNAAPQVTRTVTITSNNDPDITLVGAASITHEAATPYVDQGATAADVEDGDISASIAIVDSVDVTAVGAYTVTYNVTDSDGNAAVQRTRTVTVVDTTIPVITLADTNLQFIEAGSAYTELGASATDNLDTAAAITAAIVIDATAVNTSALGTYNVTYDVTDANGNAAVTVNRSVQVVDTTAPVITILGNNPESVAEDTVYADAGATASDNLDGDVSADITTVNNVNTSVPGAYTVTYDVTDAATNNAIQAIRNVTVTPVNDAPVLDFPVPDDAATEALIYSTDLSLYFSDEDNDTLDFSLTGLPVGSGLSINASTGVLSGTPNTNDAAASPISLTIKAEDPSLESDQDTFLLTIIQSVDLSLLMTVDDATPNEGQAIVYTVSLSNAGPSNATNIDILDLQPAGVTFGTVTPGTGSFIGNVWSVPGLASGASTTLIVNATVDAGTAGLTITNVAELTAVDQTEADVAETASANINVPTGPSVSKTWVGGASGPPGSETDWNRNNNWNPVGVPDTNDEIVIPNTTFYPVLDADLTAASLRVTGGANLDIGPHTLTITGEVRGDSPITGTGLVVVTTGTVRGGLPSLRIDGYVDVQNNLTVNGDLTVLGTLDVDTSVVVNGDLNVTGGTGILVMQVGGSLMIVNGDVLFDGGDHSVFVGGKGPMDKGDLYVSGDFTQTGNAFSFVAEAAHRVILNGTVDQTITMMNPDNSNPDPNTPPATGSRFANLYLAKDQATDGDVVLATDVAVLRQLQSSGFYDPRIVSPTGRKIVAGGASFILGTFDNVPIEFVDGNDFDNFGFATFENMAIDTVQIALRRTESFISVYHFDNLSFTTMPNTSMGGYYIEAENLGSAAITLNIWNSFPVSGASESNTIGDFALNW